MFERFTDRARRVVVLAQEEARMMNHGYIGTEHILLGLIAEGEGLAALVLEDSGVEQGRVRAFVERETGHDGKPPSGHIPFTQRAKKVLELSLREALQLRHNYIGTEHILLGLIREGEGLAAEALVDAGADLAGLRQRLLDRVGRGSRERPPEVLFAGAGSVNERLAQIQESLERIERHLGIRPQAGAERDGRIEGEEGEGVG
ncbi:ATP-dependent Clp protease ATP-binding subunit ClpC1 [Nonomuraea coxensis DSM 45129]|uniref:ATP-dependent Clp protease ATP-binding subunit ClpC1 n=1 Tax=Nonomuraea coxensis DSM 45129 TaxID=1122611 RepID=A0ABX8U5S0_9ACTN|nr:ATP-dependent Clp protease ATP-binding subunit ClpC1 [Nonomuraea coxensis DSM 45129]